MNDSWYKNIVGARTIKTGLATFLTALFCLALNLNPIFAILTAIVTIEPTAKASLIKGIETSCYNYWCIICRDFHFYFW